MWLDYGTWYFIAPCNQPHQKNHHITTVERLKTRSLKNFGLGIAVVGHPMHILWAFFFAFFFFLILPPPAHLALLVKYL